MVTVNDRETEGLKEQVKKESGVSLTNKEAYVLREELNDMAKRAQELKEKK